MANQEIITADGEVVEQMSGYDVADSSMAVSLSRAEIDMQIATARNFPRSVDRAKKGILQLAVLDEETAEECMYALPRGGKKIEGPSVRLAEIIQNQWGNCRVAARVVHVDRVEKYLEAEGVFHDLETNSAILCRVRRRISNANGNLYNDDMITMTGNAACSIAKRNAILGGVPKPVWRGAYEAVVDVVKGDAETIADTREKVMQRFMKLGVTPERVFLTLGVNGVDDITLEHIVTLKGMASAIKNGEETIDNIFSLGGAGSGEGGKKSMKEGLNDLAKKDGDKAPAEAKKDAGDDKAKEAPKEEGKAKGGKKADAEKQEEKKEAASAKEEKPTDETKADDAKAEEKAKGPDLDAARQRGREARAKGMMRKATPPEFREPERAKELDAWLEGYDEPTKPAAQEGGE